MGNRKFNADDFKEWLFTHNMTISELQRTIKRSPSILYKYANGEQPIPSWFKYLLDGVLVERMNKAKKGLDSE